LSSSLKEGWNRISEHYQQKSKISTNDVYWGDFVDPESKLKMLENVKGKRVLEIACGGAQNSIALSKWGAETFGIDLSRKQILYGKHLAKTENVKVGLLVGNVERLPFKDETFDIVTTAISLFYAPDLNATVAEANRVLVKNGHFTFSTAHPLTEGKLVKYRGKNAVAVRNYFKRRIVWWKHKLPDGIKIKMHSYYRTLQDYFDILIKNGFMIEQYVELERLQQEELLNPDKEELKENREARQLYRIMNEVPYWIIFKTRKKQQFSR